MASGLFHDVVTAQAGSTAAALVFRPQGRVHVAVIVKATFAFAADAAMPRAEPQPIHRGEVPYGPGARSVARSSDLVPYLSQADVLFTGHAHAPPSGPVRALRVRLAVLDGEQAIIDKELQVQAPFSFSRLPLVYEWAYGGPTVPENPVGTGAAAGSAPPNVIDPAHPERPAGFGPVSRDWPARAALLKGTPPGVIEAEIPEIPEGFDWSYFQAAPPDQRVAHLRGDEWIVLEGLHPTLSSLRTRLPGARARAAVHGLSAFGVEEGRSIDLVADTLHIDGDEQRCTLVWRGSFPVPSMEALAAMRITTEVRAGEALGASPPTMLLSELSPPEAPAVRDLPRAPAGAGGTILLGDAPPPTIVLDEVRAPLPGTLSLSEEEGRPRAAALPFNPSESAWIAGGVPTAMAEPTAVPESTGTLCLSGLEQAEVAGHEVMPFMASRAQSVPVEVSAPAPEAGPAAPPPPLPEPSPPLTATAIPSCVKEDDEIEIERCAEIAAEIGEGRAARAAALAAHGVSEARFREAERRWNDVIARETGRGRRSARNAYDDAYVLAWEKLRGRLTLLEYARLTVAARRGRLLPELDALGIRGTVWMRLQRVWKRRLADDPDSAAALRQLIAATEEMPA